MSLPAKIMTLLALGLSAQLALADARNDSEMQKLATTSGCMN